METARQAFAEYPDKFPAEIRTSILAGQVVLGMDTYQAYLAAGAFSYMVEADPRKWPPHSDPHRVIWAQPNTPDNSRITMTFCTDTQYLGEGEQTFRVHFRLGRATEIEKLSNTQVGETKNV
jgi:hypothetical protein